MAHLAWRTPRLLTSRVRDRQWAAMRRQLAPVERALLARLAQRPPQPVRVAAQLQTRALSLIQEQVMPLVPAPVRAAARSLPLTKASPQVRTTPSTMPAALASGCRGGRTQDETATYQPP